MKEITKAEELLMLVIWRLKKEAYGVAIKRKVQETTGKDYAYGTLYFILEQLAAKGFVNRSKGEPTPERGGRGKTYYSITPQGISALKLAKEMHRKAWDGIEDSTFDREIQ